MFLAYLIIDIIGLSIHFSIRVLYPITSSLYNDTHVRLVMTLCVNTVQTYLNNSGIVSAHKWKQYFYNLVIEQIKSH